MNFEWDSNKSAINLAKHGVSFEEATTAFLDENAILFDDISHSETEERFNLIGISGKLRILIVCHCYRQSGGTIRIISARKATKKEVESYVNNKRRFLKWIKK